MKDIEDIEGWIKQNNPYQDFEDFNMLLLKGYWSAGATAMAEHLKSQPPTKEDILKVIRMLKDPCGAVMDLTYSDEETADIIRRNWNYF